MTIILVIGAHSFSGSNFISECFKTNRKVIGTSRSSDKNKQFLIHRLMDKSVINNQYKYYEVDINRDIDKLINIVKQYKPKYIVNFASQGMVAQSWENPLHWYRTNLLSQVEFHDKLRGFSFIEKYIHVTTPEVYGDTKDEWIKENNIYRPSTPYAVSRASCDMHLRSFFEAYNFPVIFTRAANIYGAHQDLYRIIPRAVLSALTGKEIYLDGKGKTVRSFIHAKDVARATLNIIDEASIGTTWHISTNEEISIKKLVHKIYGLCEANKNTIIELDNDRLGKDGNYRLNSDKIKNELAWEPTINLENGLIEVINWIKNNLDEIRCLPWQYIHKE